MSKISRSCPVIKLASVDKSRTVPDLGADSNAPSSVDKGGVGMESASDSPDKGAVTSPSFDAVEISSASAELKVPNCGRTATEAFDSTGLDAKPLAC
jgi:hypothetical protein